MTYNFNQTALKMLCQGLREKFIGKTARIYDITIVHHPDHPPKLSVWTALEDGTELRTDFPFFEDP